MPVKKTPMYWNVNESFRRAVRRAPDRGKTGPPERKRIPQTPDCWSHLNLRLKRPAEPLPPKTQRVAKRIYRTKANNLVTYSSNLKNQVKICQECASRGIILSANYEDQEGKGQKLCQKCATAHGTFKTRRPCEICADRGDSDSFHPPEATHVNKAGEKNKLCSFHAREEETYKLLHPCELCPKEKKKEAAYRNKKGQQKKLCASCAHTEHTWKPQNPCELCPEDKKKEAAYRNKKGQEKKLCAACAHTEETWKVQNPCELCPEDKKKEATYRNKDGYTNKLCGTCAAAQGMWESKQICQCCKDGVKRVATSGLYNLFDSDGVNLGNKFTRVCFFCMDAFNHETNDFDWIKRPAEPGQGAFDEQGNHYETYQAMGGPAYKCAASIVHLPAYKCPDCDTIFVGVNGTGLMTHRSAFTLKA